MRRHPSSGAPDPALSPLERVVAQALATSPDPDDVPPLPCAAQLAAEAHAAMSALDVLENERAARQFARRTRARLDARRALGALRVYERAAWRSEPAVSIGDAVSGSAASDRLPWVDDMQVAAGTGREVWDAPVEHWVSRPAEARGRALAVSITGTSMLPVLRPGDAVVVELERAADVGSIVVARVPDGGYVVKYVAALTRHTIELGSYNPEVLSFHIPRDRRLVLGVVTSVLRAAASHPEHDT